MRAVSTVAFVLAVAAGGSAIARCAFAQTAVPTSRVTASPANVPSGEEMDGPAARVNGVPIERPAVHELAKGLARAEPAPPDSARITELSDAALESLIDLELLFQEAVRQKVDLDSTEVDSEIARVRGHFSSQEQFEKALVSRGLTPVELRLETRRTLMADRLLRQTVWRDVRVEDAEIERFYSEHRDQLERPLPELRDSIAEMLLDEKRSAKRTKLLEGLRTKATIQRFPPFAPSQRAASQRTASPGATPAIEPE